MAESWEMAGYDESMELGMADVRELGYAGL